MFREGEAPAGPSNHRGNAAHQELRLPESMLPVNSVTRHRLMNTAVQRGFFSLAADSGAGR